MQDAGIAILESFDAQIYDNTFEDVKYGVRISLGGGNNYVHDNVFKGCSKCEWSFADSLCCKRSAALSTMPRRC